MAPTVNRMMMY